MIESTFLALALVIGMALYPFFANRLPNQRQNAAAVIGVALLGFAILGDDAVPSLGHGTPLHAVMMVLSFVFFAGAFVGRKRGKVMSLRAGVLPFLAGCLVAVVGLFAASAQVYA